MSLSPAKNGGSQAPDQRGRKGNKGSFHAYPVDTGSPSQRVRVPIQPPVLADGDFRQRAEDRRPGGVADLQRLVRKRAGASESGEIQMTFANRIGMDRSIDVLIGKLRKKLGDEASHPVLVKTVRGIG